MRGHAIVLAVLMVVSLGAASAQAVEIRADDAHIDFTTGTSVYSGNVRIDDKELQLEADEVTEYREGEDVTLVVATGNPVRFRQEPIVESTFSHGHAERVEYHARTRELKLQDFTVTDTQGNVQSSSAVTYQLPE